MVVDGYGLRGVASDIYPLQYYRGMVELTGFNLWTFSNPCQSTEYFPDII